jgi:hypothetical protein
MRWSAPMVGFGRGSPLLAYCVEKLSALSRAAPNEKFDLSIRPRRCDLRAPTTSAMLFLVLNGNPNGIKDCAPRMRRTIRGPHGASTVEICERREVDGRPRQRQHGRRAAGCSTVEHSLSYEAAGGFNR